MKSVAVADVLINLGFIAIGATLLVVQVPSMINDIGTVLDQQDLKEQATSVANLLSLTENTPNEIKLSHPFPPERSYSVKITTNGYVEVCSEDDCTSSKSFVSPSTEFTRDNVKTLVIDKRFENGNKILQISSSEDYVCLDGTPYFSCSSTKPKFCNQGELTDSCQSCGCPADQSCQLDGGCSLITQFLQGPPECTKVCPSGSPGPDGQCPGGVSKICPTEQNGIPCCEQDDGCYQAETYRECIGCESSQSRQVNRIRETDGGCGYQISSCAADTSCQSENPPEPSHASVQSKIISAAVNAGLDGEGQTIALKIAKAGSSFIHCNDNTNNCGEDDITEVRCTPDGSCGIFLLNRNQHPEWFDPDLADCGGKTAYDLDCNIIIGTRYLKELYDKYFHREPRLYTCKTPNVRYSQWDAVLRYYAGWHDRSNCPAVSTINYVENVKQTDVSIYECQFWNC